MVKLSEEYLHSTVVTAHQMSFFAFVARATMTGACIAIPTPISAISEVDLA